MTDKVIHYWFQGTNLEDPLTAKRLLVPKTEKLSPHCLSFGIDSLKTYRQAITRLSWLSYSSLASARRRARHGPIPLVAKTETPHAGRGQAVSRKARSASPGRITPCSAWPHRL